MKLSIKKRNSQLVAALLSCQIVLMQPILAQDATSTSLRNRYEKAFAAKDYRAALEFLGALLKTHPTRYGLVADRGYCYMELRDYAAAVRDFSDAITCGITISSPDGSAARRNSLYSWRGYCYLCLKRYEEGIADLSRSILLISRNHYDEHNRVVDLQNRSEAYRQLGRLDKSRQDIAQIDRLDSQRYPENQSALRHEIETLTRDIERDSKNYSAYKRRGNLYKIIDENEKAVSDYTRAIELDSMSAIVVFHRGQCFERLKATKRAIADYEKAVSLEKLSLERQGHVNNVGNLLIMRSAAVRLYRMTNRIDDAIRQYLEIEKESSKGEEVSYGLGQCYFAKGLYQKAVAKYTEALSVAVDNAAIIHRARAEAFSKLGRDQDAEADRAKARKLEGRH